MARPKNDATCEAIETATYTCFLEVGYAATTYDLIAERSGKGRPLVQHYYPKKSLLAQKMFARLLAQCAELTAGMAPAIFSGTESQGASFYIAGMALFGYLSAQGQQLFLDVLKSRELTAELIQLQKLWPTQAQGEAPVMDANQMVLELAVAMGGFYELAYRKLNAGESFDVIAEFDTATSTFLQKMGCSRARAMRVISESALSQSELAQIYASITL